MLTNEQPTHLDLFSGIGGFALAAQWAGFRTVGFCEIEPFAQRVLAKNFGAEVHGTPTTESVAQWNEEQRRLEDFGYAPREIMADAERSGITQSKGSKREQRRRTFDGSKKRIYPDIRTLNGKQFAGVSLITGGFPCQPFSCAGKRRGTEDDRHLWPEMLRVIAEARPAWVLGENVAGIINMELDAVLSGLEGIGYACRPFVIPACGVDARHRRNRVWIVAHAEHAERRPEYEINGNSHGRNRLGRSGETLADADEPGSQGHGRLRECTGQLSARPCRWADEGEWFTQSGMGRVASRIPARVDRLRGLGNAIVPQVAFQILKTIAEIETLK